MHRSENNSGEVVRTGDQTPSTNTVAKTNTSPVAFGSNDLFAVRLFLGAMAVSLRGASYTPDQVESSGFQSFPLLVALGDPLTVDPTPRAPL